MSISFLILVLFVNFPLQFCEWIQPTFCEPASFNVFCYNWQVSRKYECPLRRPATLDAINRPNGGYVTSLWHNNTSIYWQVLAVHHKNPRRGNWEETQQPRYTSTPIQPYSTSSQRNMLRVRELKLQKPELCSNNNKWSRRRYFMKDLNVTLDCVSSLSL